MEVHVEYYGQAEEITGKSNEIVELEPIALLGNFIELIEAKYSGLKKFPLKYAVNSSFEDINYKLKTGDKVAVMPPFAGG